MRKVIREKKVTAVIQKKQSRQKDRRNFFLTFLITSAFWMIIILMVYFIDPENFGAVPAFFILFFIALTFTFSIILANSRRGFLGAVFATTFLILRYFGVGNIVNLLLLAGVFVAVEIYFVKVR